MALKTFINEGCCSLQLQTSKTGVQISGRPVSHGNQNVTLATWKRRKIAQLAIINSSSPVFLILNYRLSVCIVIIFLLPVQLKCFTQRNISYGFSNREPECIVYRIILRLRSTLNFGKFPKFKTYQCSRKAYGRIRAKVIFLKNIL